MPLKYSACKLITYKWVKFFSPLKFSLFNPFMEFPWISLKLTKIYIFRPTIKFSLFCHIHQWYRCTNLILLFMYWKLLCSHWSISTISKKENMIVHDIYHYSTVCFRNSRQNLIIYAKMYFFSRSMEPVMNIIYNVKCFNYFTELQSKSSTKRKI